MMFDGDILSLKHRITTTTAKNCKLQLHRKFHPNNYVFFVENFSSLPSKIDYGEKNFPKNEGFRAFRN